MDIFSFNAYSYNSLDKLSENPDKNAKIEEEVKKEVIDLCSSFPIYSIR